MHQVQVYLGLQVGNRVIVGICLVAGSHPVPRPRTGVSRAAHVEADQPEEQHDASDDKEGGSKRRQQVDCDVAAAPVEPRHLLHLVPQLLVVYQGQESAQRKLVAGGCHPC